MGDKIFKLSRTSIGANINEAQDAQSTNDFISKLSISLKEARESKYWLELLKDLEEIIKLLVSIIKSTKANNAKN
ncbi:MAG TPA: four helix bundle protein [Arcobacter sp.]|nr:four helix bundle protein [Arcobacter sp.]